MAFMASSKPNNILILLASSCIPFAEATVLPEPAFYLNSSTEFPSQLTLFLTSVKSLTY
jgi:hypothetical protein